MNILLTGGSSGIGLSILKVFLTSFENVKFFLITRYDKDHYYNLDFKEKDVDKIFFLKGDLSTFEGIEQILKLIKNFNVDICINNAGAIIEKSLNNLIHDTLILNSIAPFLISGIILKKNPKLTIINISSFLHKTIKFADITNFNLELKNISPHKIYAQSKFILNLLSFYLAKHYLHAKIYCINPGIVSSNFGFENNSFFRKFISFARNLIGKNSDNFAKDLIKFLKNDKKNNIDLSYSKLAIDKDLINIVKLEIKKNENILKIIKNYDLLF